MKKLSIIIMLLALYLCKYGQQEKLENMDILNCQSLSFGEENVLYISVVTNTNHISNKKACAKQIIQHCIDNDFLSIQFNYENHSYPSEITATVYLTKQDFEKGKSNFKMKYSSKSGDLSYNIKEHPEVYDLKITK